tara:strand:- start:546 stop:1124 length:579 start_codon:yes stop_codon:yes gene_type:complete
MKKVIICISFIFLYFLPTESKSDIKPIIEGSVDSNIKLIVYESLTCSHCAKFHEDIYPHLKEDFIDKGLASIEFRNFPLNIAALNASLIAHCKNDGKSEILHFLYNNQKLWAKGTIEEANGHLKNMIEESNFNLNVNKCLNDKKIEDYILEERIEADKKFKIEGTPTLIINGEKFKNPLDYKKLEKYLQKLI